VIAVRCCWSGLLVMGSLLRRGADSPKQCCCPMDLLLLNPPDPLSLIHRPCFLQDRQWHIPYSAMMHPQGSTRALQLLPQHTEPLQSIACAVLYVYTAVLLTTTNGCYCILSYKTGSLHASRYQRLSAQQSRTFVVGFTDFPRGSTLQALEIWPSHS
jgi:hypothetical protein